MASPWGSAWGNTWGTSWAVAESPPSDAEISRITMHINQRNSARVSVTSTGGQVIVEAS